MGQAQIQEIMSAVWKGDHALIRTLLESDRSLANCVGDAEGSRPIHHAAGRSLETVKLLLGYGADPLISGNDGNALHLAVWFERLDVVSHLLELGVDPNAQAEAGERPLHFAALKGFEKIGALLVDRGADVNAKTTEGKTDMFMTSPPVVGETPLHLAAAYGHAGFVKLLLGWGADKNAVDHAGQTARHWAARHDQ